MRTPTNLGLDEFLFPTFWFEMQAFIGAKKQMDNNYIVVPDEGLDFKPKRQQ